MGDDIVKIEYIECNSAADMAWKEIYYINYFYNSESTNKSDVFQGPVTELNLNDQWMEYKIVPFKIFDEDKMLQRISFMEKIILPHNIKNLIQIHDNYRMNLIGEEKYSLSRAWYTKNIGEQEVKQLKNNLMNYCRIYNIHSRDAMWTTYDAYKKEIPIKGIQRGYTSLLEDHLNFTDRHYLAYLCNNFFPQGYTNKQYTQDDYALSEIVWFLWRSALRNGEKVIIYIPSIRMRTLLQNWIDENSVASEEGGN